jgi:hypothetical protein
MDNLTLLIGGGSSAIALWVLKLIPNEKLYSLVNNFCYRLGTIATLGLSKWSFSKGLWNKTIEPYFVDLLNNTVKAAVDGFVKGLKSDG